MTRNVALPGGLDVRLEVAYEDDLSPNLFAEDPPSFRHTLSFESDETESQTELTPVDNMIVDAPITVTVTVLESFDYEIRGTRSRSVTVADDESYVIYARLPEGEPDAVTEGGAVTVEFIRCSSGALPEAGAAPTLCGETDMYAPAASYDVRTTVVGDYLPTASRPSSVSFDEGSYSTRVTLQTVDDEVDAANGSILIETDPDDYDSPRADQNLRIGVLNSVPSKIAIDSIAGDIEGEALVVGLSREMNLANPVSVEIAVSYADNWRPRLFSEGDSSFNKTIEFAANQSEAEIAIATVDNSIHDGGVTVRVTLVEPEDGAYTIDETQNLASTWFEDDDRLEVFVRHLSDTPGSVTEGEKIRLEFYRCSISDDDGGTRYCGAEGEPRPFLPLEIAEVRATANPSNLLTGGLPTRPLFEAGEFTSVRDPGTRDDDVQRADGTLRIQTDTPDYEAGSGEQNLLVTVNDNDVPLVSVAAASARITEGGDVTFVLTRENSDLMPPMDVRLNVNGHAKMFEEGGPPWGIPISFAAGETSKSHSLTTHDDARHEGDGEITARVSDASPDEYRPRYDSDDEDGLASVYVVDDDVPTVTLTSNGPVVVESYLGVEFTWTRTGSTARPLSVHTEQECLFRRHPGHPEVDRFKSERWYFLTTPLAPEIAPGYILRSESSKVRRESGACVTAPDGDVVNPLGGYTRFRILPLPEGDEYRFQPRYEIGTEGWVQVDIVSNVHGVRIERRQASVAEGGRAGFTVTRYGGHDVNFGRDLRVRVEVSQTGDFLAGGEAGVRVVTIPARTWSRDFEVETLDDDDYEADGMLRVELLEGANTGETEDSYEFFTELRTEGGLTGPDQYDHIGATAVTSDDTFPTLSVTGANALEGGTPLEYTFTLDADLASDTASVDWSVASGADDTATEGEDYTAASGTLSFTRGGDRSKTISVEVLDDELLEGDETLTLTLSNPVNLLIENESEVLTIIDDESPAVRSSAAALGIPEGKSVTYTLVLSSQPTGTVTVVATLGGDTGGSLDPTELSFTSENWDTPQTVTVSMPEDDDNADVERGVITHSASGGGYDMARTWPIQILANDNDEVSDRVTLRLRPFSVSEDVGEAAVTLRGILNGVPFSEDTEVEVAFGAPTDGATPGEDYQMPAGFTLTIPAGETEGTADFTIAIIDDHVDEGTEGVRIDGTAEGLTVRAVSLQIKDEDTRGVTLSETSLAIDEGGSGTYTLVLDSQPTADVTITPSLSGDSDVTLSPVSLTFTASNWDVPQTLTVSAAEDVDTEDDEASIAHAVSGGDYGSVTAAELPVSVSDDDTDSTRIDLSLSTAAVDEDAGATRIEVTAMIDGSPGAVDRAVTIAVGASGDDALEGTDYAAVPDLTLTINAGDTSGAANFTLTPVDDAIDEADEDLTVTGSADGLAAGSATLSIIDNDERGVTVSEASLTVNEGGSATYDVVLQSQPTAEVTIAVSVSGGSGVTASPASLTFTASNWADAQTVTVSAAEDADAENDAATISHTVSGGDYGSVSVADLEVEVGDNETESQRVLLGLDPDSLAEDAGASSVRVTATLDGAPMTTDTAVTVAVGASGDEAVEGTDYAAVSDLTLTINAGDTSGTANFTLTPTDDAIDEPDESLTVSGTAGDLTVESAELTIEDNDKRGVAASPTKLAVSEGGGATYTLVLTSQPTAEVTIRPSVSGDSDVTVSPASLTFTPSNWADAQTVQVRVAEDEDAEIDSAIISHAVSGGDYASLTASRVEVTSAENDTASTAIVVSLTRDRIQENAGSAAFQATAALDSAALTTNLLVRIEIGVAGDDAIEGTDYAQAADLNLRINAGDTSASGVFRLNPIDDAIDEADETLTVRGSADGLDAGSATVTIMDNDTRGVVLSETSLGINEGESATYDVVLQSQPTAEVTIAPSVSGDSGVTASPASLTFTASNWDDAQTVTVSAADDADADDGAATITHAVSGGDYAGEDVGEVSVRVIDDETASSNAFLAPRSISVNGGGARLVDSVLIVEEGAMPVTVTLSASLDGAPRVVDTDFVIEVGQFGDSATQGADYAAVADLTLTIDAGDTSGSASFVLTPLNDAIDEPDETLSIRGSSSAVGLSVVAMTVTIEDDDVRGVTLSETSLDVGEGSSGTYTLALTSQPTGDVTVTPSVTGDSDVTVSPASLTFTASNWADAQTVTVSAAGDADAQDDAATISHAVSGGDYGSVTAADLPVAVSDDETASSEVTLALSPTSVAEGAGATAVRVTATLNDAPRTTDTAVTVAVGASGDEAVEGMDYAAVADLTLTITAGDTSGSASFTLTPVGDAVDEPDESVSVSGTTGALTVRPASLSITDDDERGVAVSPTRLGVPEGGAATYSLVLTSQPTAEVTITPGVTGDSDVTVSPASLTFTASSWSVAQTVRVWVAEDPDAQIDSATISHAVSGGDYDSLAAAQVEVISVENDAASTRIDLSLGAGALAEGAGATLVAVTASLNNAPRATDTQVTLAVGATGDRAVEGTDYATVADLTLTIAAGDTSGTASFTLTPIDDAIDETDEALMVTGSADGLAAGSATLTINDDDTRGVTVSETSLDVAEGGSGTYSLVLTSQPTADVTITPSVSGDPDVTVSPASLTFTASNWGDAQTVTVTAAGDADADDDAARIAHAVSGGDYDSVAAADLPVSVSDDETASTEVTLSLGTSTLGEDAGATVVLVTATLNGAPMTAATAVTVAVGASGDDAVEGMDYAVVADLTLTIDAGDTSGSASFTLTPVDDAIDEPDEALTVSSSATGLTAGSATLTIMDNDTRGVVLSETSLTIDEGESATYDVVLRSQPTAEVTIAASVSGGTGVTASPASLTFTASNWDQSRTVTVSAANDADADDDTATITHAVSGGDYAGEDAGGVSVRVIDDETASTGVTLNIPEIDVEGGGARLLGGALVVEEGAAPVSVTLSASLDGAPRRTDTDFTIEVGRSGDGATEGTDYAAVPDLTLTIAAGDTSGSAGFVLTPLDDDIDEPDETLSVRGSSPAQGLSVVAMTVTIEDDDVRGVEVSETSLLVSEGGGGTYRLALTSEPTGDVTVTPSVTGDSDVTVGPASLTFTASNWADARTVTVSAAEDADAENDAATISHAVSGGDYGSVSVADLEVEVGDNETESQRVLLGLDPDSLAEDAGASSVRVTATLDGAPMTTDTAVTVAVGASGDEAVEGTDYAAVSDLTLTINAGDTSGTANFTLTPVDDAIDEPDESLTVSGTAGDLTVESAELTIGDNDERGVTVSEPSRAIDEGGSGTYTLVLDSQPTAEVTIAVSVSGDADVTAGPALLTFTALNWADAQTVTVSAAEDTDAEDDEATVSHAVSGGDYGSVTVADLPVTVSDDETGSTRVDLSINRSALGEDAGATVVLVTATLDGAPLTADTAVTVAVGASGDGAVEGTDYDQVSDLTLTIDAGETSGGAEFTLTPVDDAIDEADESLTVSGAAGDLTVGSATLTIEDNDERGVTISETSLTIDEGDSATYTLVLDSQPTADVTIIPSLSGDADITESPTSLTFTASDWDAPQTVTVSAAEDADAEDDAADITHSVVGGDYGSVAAGRVAVAVRDDETGSTRIGLALSRLALAEDAGATVVLVTATLDGAPMAADTAITIAVGAAGDEAVEGVDYAGVSDLTLTIDAGETSGTAEFTLAPVDDAIDEADEPLTVSGTAGDLTVESAQLMIGDNDERGVSVSETSLAIDEGGSGTYTLVLDSQPTAEVTIAVSVSGDADVTAGPASLTFTALNWADAQTVTVGAAGDADAEDDEATVSHAVSGGDYGSVTVAEVPVTVSDDETASTRVDLALDRSALAEDAGATVVLVTATLDGAPMAEDTSVTIAIGEAGDGAVEGTDYDQVSDLTLTIDAGGTSGTAGFTLTPVDDAIDEPDESLTVSGDADGLTVGSAQLTIGDDDERGVTVSETSLTIDEGGSATYTLVLDSQPTADVTIIPSLSGDADVTASPASLTFTASDWDAPRTVTVSAADDDDAEDELASITHSVVGGDYASVTAGQVSVTLRDDETASTRIALSLDRVEVEEAANSAVLQVTAALDSAPLTSDTEIILSVGSPGDTAEAGIDYAGLADLTLTLVAGESEAQVNISLSPIDDDIDEPEESLTLSGSAEGLEVTPATLTILDDDERGVEVSESLLLVSEGGSATYRLLLTSEPTANVTIAVSVRGDSDVTASPASLAFTASDWNAPQTVTVSAAEDEDAENDEATLSHSVSGGDYDSVDAADLAVEVSDNEVASSRVLLSVDPVSLAEHAEATDIAVTARLDGAPLTTDTRVTLVVGAPADAATEGTDYADVADVALTISAGETIGTAQFTLAPSDDDLDEADEALSVTGSVEGLTLESATLVILDDDERGVEVSESSLELDEGGSATYNLVLASEPTANVTISASVLGDSDVTLAPESLTFTASNWNAPQTVTVSAAEDEDAENDEATLSHSVSGGDYEAQQAGQVAVSVADDDSAPTEVVLRLDWSEVSESEGETRVTVTANLGDTAAVEDTRVTLSIGAGGDSATPGADYSRVAEMFVMIPAGEFEASTSFLFSPIDDGVDEPEERLTVSGTAEGMSVSPATLTIADDDERGVQVSETALEMDEGGSASYRLVLASEPTGPVLIRLSVSGAAVLETSPAQIEFTPENWNRAQTVTVTSPADADAEDGQATISHAVSGGDYGSETAEDVLVSVTDVDSAPTEVVLRLDWSEVSESEGETRVTVTASLGDTAAVEDTRVTLSIGAGDDGATPGADYSRVAEMSVTIPAGEFEASTSFLFWPIDDGVDEPEERLTVSGTAEGMSVSPVTLTIADDDERGVQVSETALEMDEGGTASYTLVLTSEPTDRVVIRLSVSGGGDLETSPAQLEFTPESWNRAQTVKLAAGVDADVEDEQATISHAASGGDYAGLAIDDVEVRIADQDLATRSVSLSLNVDSLGEDAGATGVTVTATLEGPPLAKERTLALSVGAESDSASAGGDYLRPSDIGLTIHAGATSGSVRIEFELLDDEIDEMDEFLTITGVAENLVVAPVKLTITDNDTRGVTISPTSLEIPEGGTASYEVVLDTRPTGDVTISAMSPDSDEIRLNPTELVFTAENWSTAQTFTLSHEPPEGAASTLSNGEMLVLTHEAAGGDYGAESLDRVTLTMEISESLRLEADPQQLAEDGGPASVTVTATLDGPPRAADTRLRLMIGDLGDEAVADSDYAVSGELELTISAGSGQGEASFTITPVDDGIEEPDERLSLTATASPGSLDVQAIELTIIDSGARQDFDQQLLKYSLATFGRGVAVEVLEAVQGRLDASRESGVKVSTPMGHPPRAALGARQEWDTHLAPVAPSRELSWARPNARNQANAPGSGRLLDLARSSSFALTSGSSETGFGALWGHAAVSRFDASLDGVNLDGEIVNGMLGADWSSHRGMGGLLVSHSRGETRYRNADAEGDIELTSTGFYPWGSLALGERLTLSAVAGYGQGDLTYEEDEAVSISTDLSLAMAALDLRGVLLSPVSGKGPELTALGDLLFVRTEADEAQSPAGELMETKADVNRLRIGLQASWLGAKLGGGDFVPRLELAMRHDGGDAEQGLGADMGAGLDWSAPELGVKAQLRARGLLTHESGGFEEVGLSASLFWDPRPGTDLGPAFRLEQRAGASATGGMQALLGADPSTAWRGRTDAGTASDLGTASGAGQARASVGYGLSLPGGHLVAVPELTLGRSRDARELNFAWRMKVARPEGLAFDLALEAARLERELDPDDAQDQVGLALRWRSEAASPLDPAFELALRASRQISGQGVSDTGNSLGVELKARW